MYMRAESFRTGEAQPWYGHGYHAGAEAPQDLEKAAKFYHAAAERGYGPAQFQRELRDVQFALHKDVEQLESRLKAANIWAMPIHSGLAWSSSVTSHENMACCMPHAPNQDATPPANHA